MTKQQLKSLIKECVCEIQQSLAEKKNKKSESPKAPAPKAVVKPAPVKKLVKKPIKKNLAKVARFTAFDARELAGRAKEAEQRGNKQAARDLNLAKQAANFMLKTGKSKVD